MTRTGTCRIALAMSFAFSGQALSVVLANIYAGVGPQHDETASAHFWQLLMVAQLPLVLVTFATADWRRRWTAPLLVLEVAAIFAACVPVWLAGY